MTAKPASFFRFTVPGMRAFGCTPAAVAILAWHMPVAIAALTGGAA